MPFQFWKTAVYKKLSLLVVSGCLTACASGSIETGATPTSPAPTVTPLVIAQSQSTEAPAAQATPDDFPDLVIWWPETLAPRTEFDANSILSEQIAAFSGAEGENFEIEFRLKRAADVGGILSSLRAASAVAPGALPDVTLMRRDDLLAAVSAGLIYPMEGLVSSAVIGDLYSAALSLGQVDGQLYGLAYLMDVLHLAYHRLPGETDETALLWTFDALLERGQPLVFPAERVNGVNETFLLQYLAAGGRLPSPGSPMTVDAAALRSTLEFYERAFRAGLVDAAVFEYASSREYEEDLAAGSTITMGVIRSDRYLRLRAQGAPLAAAPIPTASGQEITTANGWMWVITTLNPERQLRATRFINWMMDIGRQRAFAEAIHTLPSQERALRSLSAPWINVVLMHDLLNAAIPVVPENTGGQIARAMQNALIAVLTGQQTSEEAAQSVLSLVSP